MRCHSYIFFDIEQSIHSLSRETLSEFKSDFANKLAETSQIKTESFVTLGFKAGNRFMLHLQSDEAKDIQDLVLELVHTSLGAYIKIVNTFFGLKRSSQYAPPHIQENPETEEPQSPERKYLTLYPFTKTHAWHGLPFEDRKAMMKEHVGIGRTFSDSIDQLLLYGFGVDDHEFILSYEMDDLFAFQKLVMELRNTKGRAYTEYDTPLYLCTRATIEKALATL